MFTYLTTHFFVLFKFIDELFSFIQAVKQSGHFPFLFPINAICFAHSFSEFCIQETRCARYDQAVTRRDTRHNSVAELKIARTACSAASQRVSSICVTRRPHICFLGVLFSWSKAYKSAAVKKAPCSVLNSRKIPGFLDLVRNTGH